MLDSFFIKLQPLAGGDVIVKAGPWSWKRLSDRRPPSLDNGLAHEIAFITSGNGVVPRKTLSVVGVRGLGGRDGIGGIGGDSV